ncbi:hypothetical protein AKJ66_01045 [candidate division MSBL1 archaeon SCGC-AAA259E22]|uniref:Luciferase-like domain-containing protein n=1 Tax=candidate division MSBL1 archaeon SCGC-AAA259E22 TaxID=1698265 RepID=A0A133UHY9_9EURY|nr:hypothetical protein AKJ66_01045 [candidate division MSBL1 archaeon SCGC-AAA259E22]
MVKQPTKNEELGYDSIWFPDHLMGWWPQSIWTPEIVEISAMQPSPHIFMETMVSMAIAAHSTEEISVGSSVTEVFRRHPAMLAQSIVTIDHISQGRTILGIGAGEGENIVPYGMEFSKPVSRLEEALEILDILWSSEQGKTIDYDGEFWSLENAVFDLPLYNGERPSIWLGAHGPRMLELTAEYGDGWLPTEMSPDDYGEKLTYIREMMEEKSRDPSEMEAGLYARIVIGDDEEECLKIMDTIPLKAQCLAAPSELFEEVGAFHPLGKGTYGLTEYIPSKLSKEEAIEAAESVPLDVAKKMYMYGTVEDIIDKIDEYRAKGLEHIVFWNLTFFGDVDKLRSSYKKIGRIINHYKGE